MKKRVTLSALISVLVATGALAVSCASPATKEKEQTTENNATMEKVYQKKYTNADFYKDGVLQQDVVLAAYKEMMAFYGVDWTPTLEKDFWGIDFGLGDIEHVGMGGIFWYNDAEHGYFGHEIYLLPGQMIPEHWHVATAYPAKHEAWRVNKGWVYNFGTGEATPNAPAMPASQEGNITVKNFVVQRPDEVTSLKETESPHFLMAGPEGAIVTEYGTYHDGEGLRLRNPKAKM
jgi:hypothetical protein